MLEFSMMAKVVKARYIVVVMSFLGLFVGYMMRVNMNLVVIAIVNHTALAPTNLTRMNECGNFTVTHTQTANSHQLNWTDGEFLWDERIIGHILGGFYYGYILTQIIGGRLAETFSSKHVFGFSVLAGAVLTALTPMAAQWRWEALVVLRIVMGLVLGVSFPASFVLMRAWAPPDERNFMVMFSQGGGDMSSVFTLPISSYIIHTLGWEAVFYVQSVITLVWFVLWLALVYATPDQNPYIAKHERDYINKSIGSHLSATSTSAPWRKIFTSVPAWAYFLSMFSANWCYYNLLNDMPQYVNNILGESLTSNALLNSLPYAGLWITSIVFGATCDCLLKRGIISTWTIRQMASASTQLLTAIALVAVAYSGCHVTLVKALLIVTIVLQGGGHCLDCQTLDLAPNYAGTLAGISNTLGAAPGFLAPLVVGELTVGHDTISRWKIVFFIGAAVSFAGWLLFLFFGSTEEQLWNNTHVHSQNNKQVVAEPAKIPQNNTETADVVQKASILSTATVTHV